LRYVALDDRETLVDSGADIEVVVDQPGNVVLRRENFGAD
jgi:hypothetical protein